MQWCDLAFENRAPDLDVLQVLTTDFPGIGFEDREVSTLAGLILARLGRIPGVGDQLHMGNLILTVESLRGRRIEWVILELADGSSPAGGKPGGNGS